jgi:hypothetical protein
MRVAFGRVAKGRLAVEGAPDTGEERDLRFPPPNPETGIPRLRMALKKFFTFSAPS